MNQKDREYAEPIADEPAADGSVTLDELEDEFARVAKFIDSMALMFEAQGNSEHAEAHAWIAASALRSARANAKSALQAHEAAQRSGEHAEPGTKSAKRRRHE